MWAVRFLVGLGRLAGTGVKEIWLLRFLVPGVRVALVGLVCGDVSMFIGRDMALSLNMCADSAVLPLDNLLIVEALCDLGEN